MPTEPAPLTVAEAVDRAVEACDPEGRSASAADALDRLGDDDRPSEAADTDTDLLRLAARVEFDGHPPEPMRGWLAERGVEA